MIVPGCPNLVSSLQSHRDTEKPNFLAEPSPSGFYEAARTAIPSQIEVSGVTAQTGWIGGS
jgi:hypothetical protein